MSVLDELRAIIGEMVAHARAIATDHGNIGHRVNLCGDLARMGAAAERMLDQISADLLAIRAQAVKPEDPDPDEPKREADPSEPEPEDQ